jgi:hypothetical protein
MKTTILPLVTFGLLAWAGRPVLAQEVIPPPEKQPEKQPEKLPPLAPTEPGCDHGHPGVQILWMERQVPIQVLKPREIIVPQKRPALAVAFREEKRVVTEIVMKPREVTREIPFTTMKPCTEVCPETGHCTTVLKPCTEMRLVKDVVFYPTPVERPIIIRVPYVKEIEEVVPARTVILEYVTELQRRPSAIGVPTPPLPPTRWLLAPQGPHPEEGAPQGCPAGTPGCPAHSGHP